MEKRIKGGLLGILAGVLLVPGVMYPPNSVANAQYMPCLPTQSIDPEKIRSIERNQGILASALKLNGLEVCKYSLPFDNKIDEKLNVRTEYSRGPRGGSGALRFLVYLDEENFFTNKGLYEVRIFFYSTHETNMSRKEYVVNYNQQKDIMTYDGEDKPRNETDMLLDRFSTVGYTLLKKLKIDKQDVQSFVKINDFLKDVREYSLREDLINQGNLITGDHVWLNEISYYGYGKFDQDVFMDKVARAPKVFDVEITMGEESIKAFTLLVTSRSYEPYSLGGPAIGTRRVEDHLRLSAALDIEAIANGKDLNGGK
jgi:hypothetical protein